MAFEHGSVQVRVIENDGRSVLQLRLDLGILQMNRGGRQKPGHESLLDMKRLPPLKAKARAIPGLNAEDCMKLHQRAFSHHRYVAQLQNFGGHCDTKRNLRLLILWRVTPKKSILMFQQFRAYILMILART